MLVDDDRFLSALLTNTENQHKRPIIRRFAPCRKRSHVIKIPGFREVVRPVAHDITQIMRNAIAAKLAPTLRCQATSVTREQYARGELMAFSNDLFGRFD